LRGEVNSSRREISRWREIVRNRSFVFTWYFQCGCVYSWYRFSWQTRKLNNYFCVCICADRFFHYTSTFHFR